MSSLRLRVSAREKITKKISPKLHPCFTKQSQTSATLCGMKFFRSALRLLFFTLCSSLFLPAAAPDFPNSQITLPYAELKTLWLAANSKTPGETDNPLPPHALTSAHYKLTATSARIDITATLDIQTLRDGKHLIPLLPAAAQLAAIEPADSKIILREKHYALLSTNTGHTRVTLRFSLPLTENTARFTPLPATINTLEIEKLPDAHELAIRNATRQTAATYRLAPAQPIDLVLQPTPPPVTPSRWQAAAQTHAHYADGRLNYTTLLQLTTDSGSALAAQLRLPAAARLLNVKTDDLADARQVADQLHLTWKTRDIRQREILLSYELPQPATANWTLQTPQLPDGNLSQIHYALTAEPGLELTPANNSKGGARSPGAPPNATPASVSQNPPGATAPSAFPRWLAQRTARQAAVAIPADGRVNARWLPLVATSPATVENALSKLRLVTGGALLNEITYTLRHDSAIAWQLQLPAGAELQTCTLNNTAFNPINRGNNLVEFSVSPSDTRRGTTEIKITYLGKHAPLDPVSGKIELTLPSTKILTRHLAWLIEIPAAYIPTAAEGNLDIVPHHAPPNHIQFQKQLLKNETPEIQIYYQKSENTHLPEQCG